MDPGADPRAAERSLHELEAEHREIERRLRDDRGMSPETRRVLLEHLREEEEERRAAIASLRRREAGEAEPRRFAGRLTVGSLRREAPPRSGRLGSLRPDR